MIPRTVSFALLLLLSVPGGSAEIVFTDDFESGLGNWALLTPDSAVIRREPETSNRVLQLTPKKGAFSHAIIRNWQQNGDFRMEGRFLFPTEGDGYLGVIYNYLETRERTDFGCLYVKSNGSYLRVSPHYDGNPSWRLYEDHRRDLTGNDRIRSGTWYTFRLDVRGRHAELTVGGGEDTTVTFSEAPTAFGTFGLEARPGFGEPVWIDDVVIRRLPESEDVAAPDTDERLSPFGEWEFRGPVEPSGEATPEAPPTSSQPWKGIMPDARGALITGAVTQFRSGTRDVLYLRTRFDAGDAPQAAWLAISTANRLDVWLNGHFRGTVAPEEFIWSDHVDNPDHAGARVPIVPSAGMNEILIRVHGDRFAGGGFFIDLLQPDAAL